MVFNRNKKFAKETEIVESLVRKLPKLAEKKNLSLEVFLVSDSEMKKINRKFKGKNRPTNVLSFEAEKGSLRPDLGSGRRFLGEIFLAPDYIRARGENIGFLFIHGFLHLLGYTHKGKRDRIRMEILEEELCLKSLPGWISARPR
ncbi:MAG: rRNA maturation RNase YbeY [Patescibacteria group bacterium]